MRQIAVLFARSDSIYKSLPGCDVFDLERDGLTFQSNMPVVAHPPCRAFGRLRHFAKPRPGEKELAYFSVDQVRLCGGVLEHPVSSTLWAEKNFPHPGSIDLFGGYTIQVKQFWWGHKADKATWLYICGLDRSEVEPAPLRFAEPTHCVAQCSRSPKLLLELSKADRERTPVNFAEFLVDLARRSDVSNFEIPLDLPHVAVLPGSLNALRSQSVASDFSRFQLDLGI